jgi:RimJ/RimL family protein N-acetyltransferase
MMEISFRKLDPIAARQYRQIRLESLKNHPESFTSTYEEQNKLPKLKLEEEIERESKDLFVVGAFDREEIIGICGFIPFGLSDYLGLKNAGTIVQMYVKPAYSGRKIGLNLIRATFQEAFKITNIDRVVLGVKEDNLRAIRVYEQAGFQLYPPEPTKNGYLIMIIHRTAAFLLTKR